MARRDAEVRAKAAAAHRAGLAAIVCVGETRDEREAGRTLAVVREQLRGSVPEGSTAGNLVVAYEPVWAIGTGLTPTPADVAEVHASIRDELRRHRRRGRAGKVRILYGGSVKPSNAARTDGGRQRGRRARRRREPRGGGFPGDRGRLSRVTSSRACAGVVQDRCYPARACGNDRPLQAFDPAHTYATGRPTCRNASG